jgi:chromosomal replication initiation ATPase DnaA
VDGDSYLLELLRYIHRNPLDAGMVKALQKYTWSSHSGYLSGAKKWDWLHKNYILSLFSKNKAESVRKYKQFVSKETLEEINQIFGRRNLPTIIGRKSFVDTIKDKFFTNKTHEEIPASKSLAPDVDTIIDKVCKYYEIRTNDLLLSRRGYFNEPRNVAIYLIRHLRNDTLKDVGKFFGIVKNSTISSIDRRLKREMIRDKKIKRNVETLKFELSKGQE